MGRVKHVPNKKSRLILFQSTIKIMYGKSKYNTKFSAKI